MLEYYCIVCITAIFAVIGLLHMPVINLVLCASICCGIWKYYDSCSAIEKVKRMKEQEALMSAEDQQQSVDEITKLEPIMEEDNPNEDKSSSLYNDAVLVSKSGEPVVPKRRVTIVDCYTNGAGDLSTTVGKQFCFFIFAYYNPACQ